MTEKDLDDEEEADAAQEENKGEKEKEDKERNKLLNLIDIIISSYWSDLASKLPSKECIYAIKMIFI